MLGAGAGGKLGIVDGATSVTHPARPAAPATRARHPPGDPYGLRQRHTGRQRASDQAHRNRPEQEHRVILPDSPCASSFAAPRFAQTARRPEKPLPPHDPELGERDERYQIPRLHLCHILRDVDQPVGGAQAGDQA